MVAQFSGIAPQRALLAQLPFIDDVDAAMEELAAQRAGQQDGEVRKEKENPDA